MIYWSKYSGIYLMLTGVIHNVIGLIMAWPILLDIHQDGWFNTIESSAGIHYDRSAILWFLLVGFFWMLLGYLMHAWLKQLNKPLPSILGYGFILLGGVTCILLPASGAWLFLPQGVVIVLDNFKGIQQRAVA